MSVAQLKELHDRYRCGDAPTYSWQTIPGIGFTALCCYRSRQTEGSGKSKKDSQRQAAERMLELLEVPVKESTSNATSNSTNASSTKTTSLQRSTLNAEQEMRATRFLCEYMDDGQHGDARLTMSADQRVIDEVDMGLKKPNAPTSTTLSNFTDSYGDAIDTFKLIMKEMNLKFSCKVPEIKSTEGLHIVLVQIHYRYLMAGGTGDSPASATYAACSNAIKMLRIFIS